MSMLQSVLKVFPVRCEEEDVPGLTKGIVYLVTYNGAHLASYRGHDDDGDEFTSPASWFTKLDDRPLTNKPVAARRVEYLGESDGSAAKDLTIGNIYELEDSFVSVTGKFVKIHRDDAGDPHDVHSHNVRPVANKKKMKCHAPQPANPVPDLDDWSDDDWAADEANDAFCNTQGIEAIVRDVVPEPEGPKSTEDLRAHRYTPDLY